MDFYVVQTDPSSLAVSADSSEIASGIASGKKVVDQLWKKLKADAELLSLKILSLDTVICQNECSGHGTCHQATRTCICDAFWMENFVRRDGFHKFELICLYRAKQKTNDLS